MITIRNFRDEDAPHLWQLFYHTIRIINRRDYSEAQVQAWASDEVDAKLWLQKMQAIQPFVAELDNQVVGYTDLQDDGLIDHFFCHHEQQGKGIGSALMRHVHSVASDRGIKSLHSHVSKSAKPFYMHFSFTVVEAQQMHVRGQVLENFLMEKIID